MNELNKGSVAFKHKPEDFIVEEIAEDGRVSEVSLDINAFENVKVDFRSLNVNDKRDFLYCDVEKINIDHFSMIEILGNELHNYPHELGYAGTKDKAAWTCQRISIFNADIEKIRNFSYPGIILKNFRWGKHKIKTGDLKGNRFRITLRDVDRDAIKILSRVRNSEHLPNLFGGQRFGSLRKENVTIGRLILKGRYREAVFAYLTAFGENESEEVKNAKKKLKSEKKLGKAINYFPEELKIERKILDYLDKNKEDWLGALKIIGEKTLLIMCQAVQSRLFNDIIEKALNEGINLNNQSISLIGYNTKFAPGRLGRIEHETLEENWLELEDFNNQDMPFLKLSASSRKALFKVHELDVQTADDDLFPLSKKIMLSFVLDSGVYATTFLEQFFELRRNIE
jgi:tRNA pseudouridine13 synthase